MTEFAHPSLPPPTAAGDPAPSPAARMMRQLPRILLARLIPLALIGVASVAVAVVSALTLGQSTYHISAQMVYTPLPGTGGDGRKLYEPPDLRTLTTLVKSAGNLARLKQEFHLVEPVRLLEQSIEVSNPSMTDTLDLKLDWGDADQGRRMLDRLMRIFAEQVADMRREKLKGYVADMEASVRLTRTRRRSASDAIRDFNAAASVEDIATAPEQIADQIVKLEIEKDKAEVEEARFVVAVQDSERLLDQSKREEAEKAEKEAAEEAQQESMTDIRNQQNRLSELLEAERFQAEIIARIEVKRNELNREMSLYKQSLSTLEKVERIRGELTQLYARIEKTPRIIELEADMAELDKAIVPQSTKKKPKQSPIIMQLLARDMHNKQELLKARAQIDFINQELLKAHRRSVMLQQLRNEAESLQLELDSVDERLAELERQKSTFEQLVGFDPHEFTVTSPASHLLTPPSSNKKKVAVVVLAASLLLLAGPLLAWDLFRSRKGDASGTLERHGFGVISPPLLTDRPFGRRQALNVRRWCDQVSLRIQQLAPQPGSVVLLTHHRPTELDGTLWYGTAAALAERDETVCVVLAQPDDESHAVFVGSLTQPGRPDRSPAQRFTGLTEYLTSQTDSVDELIVHTPRRNVDVVTAGMTPLVTNRMATRRMDGLITQLRERYSIVLLVGPEFGDTLGVEIVARQADGVIVCGEEGAAFGLGEDYTLQSLIELNAPVWGHVLRPVDDLTPQDEHLACLTGSDGARRIEA